ncbi:hypothetical protein MTR_8g036110 [Medicago truncatula]|uniref:Uncharacterized protein n=1 Tax=Medicago truncatula TaxID=3880 RepID=A0A072TQC3_MEDTR|nr:hypothetical protein MTR_8g036110 [Medicago truncatula]
MQGCCLEYLMIRILQSAFRKTWKKKGGGGSSDAPEGICNTNKMLQFGTKAIAKRVG